MSDLVHNPVFAKRPSDDYVAEWAAVIAATGYPERFRDVSTTQPPKEGEVVLLSYELAVPILRREDQEMVPCPICKPDKPKFKVGRMAWFPDEQVVRFIGHDCAKQYFGDGYRLAKARFGVEQRCRVYVGRWQKMQACLSDWQDYADVLAPIAADLQAAVDVIDYQAPGFRGLLHNLLTRGQYGVITSVIDESIRDNRGQRVSQSIVVGEVSGIDFLDVKFNPERVLNRCRAVLADIAKPLPAWNPHEPDPVAEKEIETRGKAAYALPEMLETLHRSIQQAQQFFLRGNLAILSRWSAYNDSPFAKLEIKLEQRAFTLRSESFAGFHAVTMQMFPHTLAAVPDFPSTLWAYNWKSVENPDDRRARDEAWAGRHGEED